MDSTDDDFGELYVDVKVQATAAFAGDVGYVKSCEESECAAVSDEKKGFEGTVKPESQGETKISDVVATDSSPCVDACAAVNLLTEANEESEYSDSDDDLNIVLKDDDSKVLHVASGSNTDDGGYVEPSQTCSSQKRRIGNWCTMPNGRIVNGRMTMEASANSACIDPSLGIPQCGYNFSSPWSRTNFDVNLNLFEKKPWRNPGTDITDFFNFGFNEQSWKDYCKPLTLGRAIEVQGGTLERMPTVDLRHPRDSDPDVVIQIPVTDVKEPASMTRLESRSLSRTSNKASESEEFHSDNGKDLNSSGDSMKDEAYVGCQDENTGSFRSEQSSPVENSCSREVTPCDKEIIEEEKEESCWNSDEVDSSSAGMESSPEDHFRFSPTSSYPLGKTEESEDFATESSKGGATDDKHELCTSPRTRFVEHEAHIVKSRESSGTKHSRHRRSREDPSKRHRGRTDYGVHRRSKHGIVKDASPKLDPDLGKKVFSGRGSLYRDSSKNWHNGPLFTSEKVETEGKDIFHSNREKRHGRSYSSMDLDRDRKHRFCWRNNKETSQGRGFNLSNGYKNEARLKEYTSRSSINLNQRNSRLSFSEEDDRYGRQHCERKYGRERSPGLAYENNKERNRYDWLREPYYQDRIPITDMEYRYRFEYSSPHGRHNPKQSREKDLHCRIRGDYDYNFHLRRYEDGVHRAESDIPFALAYRERHSFSEVGRRKFAGYEINEEFSEIDRRQHYAADWDLDRFVSEKDDYKYRIQDAWPLPSLSLRDSWYTKGSRGDYWRDDTRDFTASEAYESQNNQLYKTTPRDGWTRNLVHSGEVNIQDRLRYDDDWVHRGRRRYQLGDDIQCPMREVAHSEHPSDTDEMLVRDIRMSAHNRMSTKQRHGYFKSHIHDIDERDHRSKKLRGDGHTFIKCQDSVDLTCRQGKLSNQSRRRFSKGGDIIEQRDRQKPRNIIGRGKEKAVAHIQGLNEREEGEIIEEARNVKGNEIGEERIQESLKKMEKRRERFKGTELVVATFQSQTEPGAKTDDTNQERPVRKRRWCES